MNRVEVRSLIELVPVMQAFLDGKPVQMAVKADEIDPYFEPKWETYAGDDPNFNNGNLMWRIKPEPKEFWIVTYSPDRCLPTVHSSLTAARSSVQMSVGLKGTIYHCTGEEVT